MGSSAKPLGVPGVDDVNDGLVERLKAVNESQAYNVLGKRIFSSVFVVRFKFVDS